MSIADVIEHLESPSDILRELRRVTKPGGIVVVATPQRESLFKSIAKLANRVSRGKLYEGYYAGKETELDEDGRPVMHVAVGHDHISEMNLDELLDAGRRAGLEPDGVVLMPIFSGSTWFDLKPLLLVLGVGPRSGARSGQAPEVGPRRLRQVPAPRPSAEFQRRRDGSGGGRPSMTRSPSGAALPQ